VVEDEEQELSHWVRPTHEALLLQAAACPQQHLAKHVPHASVAMEEQRGSIPPHTPSPPLLDLHVPEEQLSPVSHVPFDRHGHVAAPAGQFAHPELAPTASTVPNNANVRIRPDARQHFVHVPICDSPFN
jgi:hypothetical protein